VLLSTIKFYGIRNVYRRASSAGNSMVLKDVGLPHVSLCDGIFVRVPQVRVDLMHRFDIRFQWTVKYTGDDLVPTYTGVYPLVDLLGTNTSLSTY
jgi:hypothetical protein